MNRQDTMKKMRLMPLAALVLAMAGLTGCADPAMKINTPAVRAQVIGDVEKVLLAGGGALLMSGGDGDAAVAAMTAQEVRNIPELQRVLDQQRGVASAKNAGREVRP
ncbi:hypothetical protein [Prosthecobacter sp.]|uniref:hypothetical protein n=1 Tax=Prosthecobacter sp. TaxID=1965333 RepID=UPI00378387C7